MVVICSRAGGLGNCLFVFAHFIANALEFNYEVANPSFFQYSKYFKTTRSDLFCRYPSKCNLKTSYQSTRLALYYLLYSIFEVYSKIHLSSTMLSLIDISKRDRGTDVYDLSQEQFIHMQKSARFVLTRGWLFRDYVNTVKHRDAIREFFLPLDSHVEKILQLIDKARNGSDCLIGVHIRQGDYSKFSDGKYYYHVKNYYHFMEQAVALFPKKRVKFLICSNVSQDEKIFQGIPYTMGNNHLVEDMYAFSKCDYLIGPPSTYTGWASFYGSVPIFTVTTANDEISLDKLKIWQG